MSPLPYKPFRLVMKSASARAKAKPKFNPITNAYDCLNI
jgi:hypothetical protein